MKIKKRKHQIMQFYLIKLHQKKKNIDVFDILKDPEDNDNSKEQTNIKHPLLVKKRSEKVVEKGNNIQMKNKNTVTNIKPNNLFNALEESLDFGDFNGNLLDSLNQKASIKQPDSNQKVSGLHNQEIYPQINKNKSNNSLEKIKKQGSKWVEDDEEI